MKRGGPLKQRSDKRVAEDREREKAKAVVRQRARGGCEAQGVFARHLPERSRCSGPFEFHEVLTRARGGSITDPDNIIMVCQEHHRYITMHPAESAAWGLVRHSWTEPPRKPVRVTTRMQAANVRPLAVSPRPRSTTPNVVAPSAPSGQPGLVTLIYQANGMRPWTLNGERKMVPKQRAAKVKEWRKAFAGLGQVGQMGLRYPRLAWADVEVVPHLRNGVDQDVGGCISAAKAAVDGLRDAGVIPGDGREHVRSLKFYPPVLRDVDALEVRLTGPLLNPPKPDYSACYHPAEDSSMEAYWHRCHGTHEPCDHE